MSMIRNERKSNDVTREGDFLVHYSMNPSFWKLSDFDDALTLEDARKLASARTQLGYHTRISTRRYAAEP